jgi:RNA polymerase sigma-70 factor, ECF subfamily
MAVGDGLPVDQALGQVLAARPDAAAERDEIARLLEQGLTATAAAWPTLPSPDAGFVAFIVERIDPAESVAAALPQIHVSDLYLAYRLTLGDEQALECLEAHFLPDVEATVRGSGLDSAAGKDTAQEVRRLVLVGEPGKAPRIIQYSGRGRLAGWLKVIATRAALRTARRVGRETPADDEKLSEIPTPGDAPELHVLKQKYGAAFRQAFIDAVQALPVRERNLLRQSVIDGLSIDDLGRLYGAHRATAARWLQDARRELLAGTRERMVTAVGIPEDECDSIMRLVHSQLDVTLRRLL